MSNDPKNTNDPKKKPDDPKTAGEPKNLQVLLVRPRDDRNDKKVQEVLDRLESFDHPYVGTLMNAEESEKLTALISRALRDL